LIQRLRLSNRVIDERISCYYRRCRSLEQRMHRVQGSIGFGKQLMGSIKGSARLLKDRNVAG
jgi:hypothetical protein